MAGKKMQDNSIAPERSRFHRTRGEEWANGITHLIGFLLGIATLVLMCVFSACWHTAIHITSCAIFGSMLIILYLASTLYHLVKGQKIKKIFQTFDHMSIYLLIAGTYTPYALLAMTPAWGWTIFGLQWGLAIIGIFLECLLPRKKADKVSLPLFVCMGWMLLIAFSQVIDALPSVPFWLLCAGGFSYTAGVIFYVMDRVPYMHTIWHLFVLGGSICHGLSLIFYEAYT